MLCSSQDVVATFDLGADELMQLRPRLFRHAFARRTASNARAAPLAYEGGER